MIRGILIAAIVLAGCAAGAPGAPASKAAEPTPRASPEPVTGTGEVTFGASLDETLKVEGEASSFAVGQAAAFSGNFSEPAGATTLDIIVSSVDAGGAEGVVYTEAVSISSPEFDIFGIEDIVLSTLVGDAPGDYVLRFYREATELAEGTFTITE